MSAIKVVIADDSAVYRSQIREALETIKNVRVAASASNGRLAIEQVKLTKPDLLILDMEMPELNGIETLDELQRQRLKVSTIVFASAGRRGAEAAIEALKHGAIDFVPKPANDGSSEMPMQMPCERIRTLLEPKIQALSKSSSVVSNLTQPRGDNSSYTHVLWDFFKPKLIVMGSSTGGPSILENIFSQIRKPLNCPIIIVQHMPPIFTTALAERLAKCSGLQVVEAKDREVIQDGHVYVAPGDFHLRLKLNETSLVCRLDRGSQINSVRPAVDALFESVAPIFKEQVLAFVLSGMGADGCAGAQKIKEAGGAVVIQNKTSCVVYGMPGAVESVGAFDRVATPNEIADLINKKATPTIG